MTSKREWTPRQSSEFLDAVATLGAGAKVFGDGVQYVDDVQFWRWLTTDVVKAPVIYGVPLPLDSADAIQEWVSARLADGNKGKYVQHIFQNRGAEFDFVRWNQHDPVEFLKGNSWRMATPLEDRDHGIDAVRRNFFSGQEETHQVKAGLSDSFRRVDLSKYSPGGPKPVDVVDVNEKIHDWRTSEDGQSLIAKRGDAHPDVRRAFSDDRIAEQGERRMDQARSGAAAPNITFEGVATQVGRGALIGAVVGVGVSTVSNYGRYRRGEIDGATFGNLMIADSGRGAVMGGAVAAVNIPVQLAAHALGVGNPVTIPVMIVVGAGLRYVIDPMFGRGAYAEHLQGMQVTTDVAQGVARFAGQCQASFEAQRDFLEGMAALSHRATVLNRFSDDTDALLADAIDDI